MTQMAPVMRMTRMGSTSCQLLRGAATSSMTSEQTAKSNATAPAIQKSRRASSEVATRRHKSGRREANHWSMKRKSVKVLVEFSTKHKREKKGASSNVDFILAPRRSGKTTNKGVFLPCFTVLCFNFLFCYCRFLC